MRVGCRTVGQGDAQGGKGGYQGVEEVRNWNLHSFQLLEIIQVLDSISWVRCASGNVYTCLVSRTHSKIISSSFLLNQIMFVFN